MSNVSRAYGPDSGIAFGDLLEKVCEPGCAPCIAEREAQFLQLLYKFSLDAFESDLWICVVTFCAFVKINALSHCVFFSPGQVRVKMRLFKSSSASKLLKKTVNFQGTHVSHFKGSWEDDVPLP